jgi:hypothetical protein
MIHQPSRNDQQEIDKTLRLDTEASKFLWDVVQRLVNDIEQHASMQAERSQGKNRHQQLAYIRKISRSLTELMNNLANGDANTDRIIRSQLGTTLGELLSHRGFEQLIRTSPSYEISIHCTRESSMREGPYRAFEEEMIQRRISIARRRAPDLLLELVRNLNDPLVRFLEIERQNRGGAPGRPYRNYVISELAPTYERVWGKSPTSTPRGRFATMCELILDAIGLETDGTDKAVARILSRNKSR